MLKLYGHPVSQPSRAVAQLLFIKNVKYDYVRLSPIEGETVTPKFLSKFPFGYVPAIEEEIGHKEDGGQQESFCLAEGAAILSYLCNSRGWSDFYPEATAPRERARVDEWLSWSRNLRRCTDECMRPLMLDFMRQNAMEISSSEVLEASTAKIGMSKAEVDDFISSLTKNQVADIVGQMRKNSNSSSSTVGPFLCGASPTIADLHCFCELDQLDEMQLLTLPRRVEPQFALWMDQMQQLPGHVECRKPMKKLCAGISKMVLSKM